MALEGMALGSDRDKDSTTHEAPVNQYTRRKGAE